MGNLITIKGDTMKKTAFFLLLLSFSAFLTAQEKHNLLEYSVFAETTLEADYVKLNIEITKKDKSFEKASSECNRIITKIAAYLKQEQGLTGEDIYKTKFNIQLSTKVFAKEVTVSSNLTIKLTDQAKFQQVITELEKIDNTLKIKDITYGLENNTKDETKKKLIKIASARANELKAEYEKNLFITLKLYSVDTKSGSGFAAEGPPGFDDNIPPAYRGSLENTGRGEESSFPVFHFKLTLFLKYEIISG